MTDIAYIRTHQGWLYLAVVPDHFSRQMAGWSMRSRMDREVTINALLMPVWCRQPKQEFIVHSDQGSQSISHGWQAFPKEHNRMVTMSRRGNCHDNTAAESFCLLPKRERMRRKTYLGTEEARRDVFDYIGIFYNLKRRHGYNQGLAPVEFEKPFLNRLESVY